MCVPVVCDIILGIPTYVYWVKSFSNYITDYNSCIVYNVYVLVTMLCILLYAEKAQKKYYRRDDVIGVELSSFRVPALDAILIVVPVIWIVAKYGLSAFYGYTTLNRRAVDSESVWSINQLITLSINGIPIIPGPINGKPAMRGIIMGQAIHRYSSQTTAA